MHMLFCSLFKEKGVGKYGKIRKYGVFRRGHCQLCWCVFPSISSKTDICQYLLVIVEGPLMGSVPLLPEEGDSQVGVGRPRSGSEGPPRVGRNARRNLAPVAVWVLQAVPMRARVMHRHTD